jgi:hypothetical protein
MKLKKQKNKTRTYLHINEKHTPQDDVDSENIQEKKGIHDDPFGLGLNATFNNNFDISLPSVLSLEDTGVLRENHRQTYHIMPERHLNSQR